MGHLTIKMDAFTIGAYNRDCKVRGLTDYPFQGAEYRYYRMGWSEMVWGHLTIRVDPFTIRSIKWGLWATRIN